MSDEWLVLLCAVAPVVAVSLLWLGRRRRRADSRLPSAGPPHLSRLDWIMALVAVLTFAATRFIGLADYPIYFFTDEAAGTVQAADFLHNGFRDANGNFFPPFFENNEKISLGTTVYAQVIPYALFGESVFITRAVSAWIALFGTLAVGLILRSAVRARGWWAGILILSVTPAWFLHTRTAFETVTMVSFYAWFLYFYMQYRGGRPRCLPLAVLFAALSFYSYSTGQPVIALTALLLLISDAPYHGQFVRARPRAALAALGLAVVLAAPYLQFQALHPGDIARRLQLLGSYWVEALPAADKVGRFAQEYLRGLGLDYWFLPDNGVDIARHQLQGYGNLLLVALPFALIGVGLCLRRFRSSPHRAVLIAAVAAPVGAALASILITRLLAFVVPAALLTALGLEAVLSRVTRRIPYPRAAVALAAILCGINVWMLRDALVNGPTWYADYGIGGMQYGAKEIFAEVSAQLGRHPETQVWIFPTWLNGPDTLRRFFARDDPRVYMLNFEAFVSEPVALDDRVLVVAGPVEYDRLQRDAKFADLRIERVLNLPDGRPGVYFLRLRYAPGAAALFAAEAAARQQLIEEEMVLDGQRVTVRHSPFDIGQLADVFDGNPDTLARTRAANPVVIEIAFARPRRLTGVTLATGGMDAMEVILRPSAGEGVEPGRYAQSFSDLPPDPTLELIFDPAPGLVTEIRIEVKDPHGIDAGHVHLRDIRLDD